MIDENYILYAEYIRIYGTNEKKVDCVWILKELILRI